jgi:hypothetical protein
MIKIKFRKKIYELEKHYKKTDGGEIIIVEQYGRLKDAFKAIDIFHKELKVENEETRWCALVYPRV